MAPTHLGLSLLLFSCSFATAKITWFTDNIVFEGNYGDVIKVLLMEADRAWWHHDDRLGGTDWFRLNRTGPTQLQLRGSQEGDEFGMDFELFIRVGHKIPGQDIKCYYTTVGTCSSNHDVCDFNLNIVEIGVLSKSVVCLDEFISGV